MVGCFASYLLAALLAERRSHIDISALTCRSGSSRRDRRTADRHGAFVSSSALLAGLINGVHRRLRPHPADHRDAWRRAPSLSASRCFSAHTRRQDRRRSQLGADQFARRFRLHGPHFRRRRRALVRAVRRIPVPFVLLLLIVLVVWVPFRRTVTGRTVYAIGSAEGAAYMSGLDIDRGAHRRLHARRLLRRPAAACSWRSRPPPATPTFRRPAPIR